jgi:hypothetical protein
MAPTHQTDDLLADHFLWEAVMPPPVPEAYFEDSRRGVRLYRGDALHLLERAKEGVFDLIFADPPYFLSNDGVTCHAGKMVSVNKGVWDRAETFEAVYRFNEDWLKLRLPRCGCATNSTQSNSPSPSAASPSRSSGSARR